MKKKNLGRTTVDLDLLYYQSFVAHQQLVHVVGADFGERSCPVGHGTAKRESAVDVPPNPSLQYVLRCDVVF